MLSETYLSGTLVDLDCIFLIVGFMIVCSYCKLIVIPHSEKAGTKPPYVCPGCFIHTYSNNMINRFHIQ
jgi:hypothetical protein